MTHNHKENISSTACPACMNSVLDLLSVAKDKNKEIVLAVKINEIIDYITTIEEETKFGGYAENYSLNKMAKELLQEKPALEKEEKEDHICTCDTFYCPRHGAIGYTKPL